MIALLYVAAVAAALFLKPAPRYPWWRRWEEIKRR